MRKTSVLTESSETACPACGAVIKAPTASRRRRVQCPKCREVVFLESSPEKPPGAISLTTPVPETAAHELSRIESLEARVELLEAALRDSMAARTGGSGAVPGAPARKLQWLNSEPGHAPNFSPEQGRVLFHNLGTVRKQAITIRAPAGDQAAQAHAEWFKSIFEQAGWTVRGPEEVTPDAAEGLSLAVPELPVAREAAATYFALKAAGFAPTALLDASLAGERDREAAAMVLTLPAEKAA